MIWNVVTAYRTRTTCPGMSLVFYAMISDLVGSVWSVIMFSDPDPSPPELWSWSLCTRVEWFSLLRDFRKRHISADLEFSPKNRLLRLRARGSSHARQSFHFQRIAETLKTNIYIFFLAETFLIHQRTIPKKKIQN